MEPRLLGDGANTAPPSAMEDQRLGDEASPSFGAALKRLSQEFPGLAAAGVLPALQQWQADIVNKERELMKAVCDFEAAVEEAPEVQDQLWLTCQAHLDALEPSCLAMLPGDASQQMVSEALVEWVGMVEVFCRLNNTLQRRLHHLTEKLNSLAGIEIRLRKKVAAATAKVPAGTFLTFDEKSQVPVGAFRAKSHGASRLAAAIELPAMLHCRPHFDIMTQLVKKLDQTTEAKRTCSNLVMKLEQGISKVGQGIQRILGIEPHKLEELAERARQLLRKLLPENMRQYVMHGSVKGRVRGHAAAIEDSRLLQMQGTMRTAQDRLDSSQSTARASLPSSPSATSSP